ncbi:hypothetical protein KO481_40715 [Nocardia sp. NEAU-G5]|uniref:Uncharacterized protein n=1 Tax=Nocardia albiluteola TaxID=2842303 RepID=A0ABS6BC12_9NOCA|nr:hypothetical protein [Nocardia albiluteola]MBU3067824.1 hypothetical protein [Nocardia albiluteola]
MIRTSYAGGSFDGALEMVRQMYLDPVYEPRVRAFFYVLGLAVQDPDTYQEFLGSLNDWTELFTALAVEEELLGEAARNLYRVWSMRGLWSPR